MVETQSKPKRTSKPLKPTKELLPQKLPPKVLPPKILHPYLITPSLGVMTTTPGHEPSLKTFFKKLFKFQ